MDNKLLALLVLLILMVIAYFVGRFLSKLFGGGESVSNAENEQLQLQISEKEAALASCRQKSSDLSLKLADAEKSAKVAANSITAAAPVAAAAASSLAADTVVHQKDDLKVIEGIGPKIEELLHSKGILSFAQLANTSVETINSILDAAGPNYRIHDPGTWPQQSQLCADGKWTALKILQDELNAGKTE